MYEAFGVHFLKTLIGKALNLVWDEDAKLSTAAFDHEIDLGPQSLTT